ncbi:hypothetical protein GCM10023311_22030 [Flaviramulus aquimarinus]|uniref:Uncharacterized protein n=1 Tax=Flaviramulus aquimarinus TaxID=1170456 RepID=A0ABP9F918_9FLAO
MEKLKPRQSAKKTEVRFYLKKYLMAEINKIKAIKATSTQMLPE